MVVTAVYDACVLYPAPLRDLLMRVAHAGLVRARWTETILDECFRSILAARPDLDARVLERTRWLMNVAVADSIIEGHEALMDGLDLPDRDDRHVLAAAVHGSAQVIVTMNLRDFPANRLAPFGIEAQHPDDFVLSLIAVAPRAVSRIIVEQAAALRNPPRSIAELLDTLRKQGLARSVAKLRELLGPVGQ